jgi:hypothetical protein
MEVNYCGICFIVWAMIAFFNEAVCDCRLILMAKLHKGRGVHTDIVLLSLLNLVTMS